MLLLKKAPIWLFALLLSLQPCLFANAAAPAAKKLEEIKQQCDKRIQLLGENNSGISQAVKDNLKAMLAETEKAVKKEPAAAVAATGGIPPEKVIEAAKTAQASAELYVSLSESMKTQAAKELVLAEKAEDPTVKLVHYQQSLDYLGQGEALSKRAASGLAGHEATPAAPSGPVVRPLTFSSQAFDQVNALAKALEGKDPNSQLNTLQEAWGGAVQKVRDAAGTVGSTPFFEGQPSSYSNGVITLGDGTKIDATAIEDAAAGETPAAERKPLFRPVPAPDGNTTSLMVDPSVVNRAREAASSPNVGGVALQVAFLSLDAAGVTGFQGSSYLEGVDQIVLISLQGLLARVKPHAADPRQWAVLPDELRFPGEVGRVIGYVLDTSRKDVVLVAAPAKRQAERLDIDSLILGLRAGWREQISPKVSLDPSPADPLGPQLSRVEGLPRDSIMAKVMLEADYMMKGTLLGQRKTDVASYRSFAEILKANFNPHSQPRQSRFWFYPKPLSPYSMAVSGSRRTATFNAELQVLTEQMATQGGTFVSSGTVGDTEGMAAFAFTQALDALADSASTDPEALLARLRGLASTVTLGAMLRKAENNYPVLNDFSGLPYRRLDSSEAAPAQYPGIVEKIEEHFQNRVYIATIGGGVDIMPRPPRSSQGTGADRLALFLEREVDEGKPHAEGILRKNIPVVLARTDGNAIDLKVDQFLLKGSAAFAGGRFEDAVKAFRSAIGIDPASVDSYVNLAFSLSRLGRDKEARAAIHTARLLEPEDDSVRLVEFAILKSNEPWSGSGDPRKVYRELRNLYLANARHALYQNHDEQAYAWASDAIAIDRLPPAAEAYYLRGAAGLKNSPEKACADFLSARRETEYVAISGGAYDDDARLFALSSLGLAQCSTQQMLAPHGTGTPPMEITLSIAEGIKQTIDDLMAVQKILPAYSPVLNAILRLEGQRYSLLEGWYYKPEMRAQEFARLVLLGEEILSRFPGSADAYSVAGQLSLDLKDAEHAITICSRLLEENHLDTGCLIVRGTALALSGKCDEALKDMSVASRDVEFGGMPEEIKSRCGDR